jgi:hypothetical protein
MTALEVVLFAWPACVAALWVGLRRRGGSAVAMAVLIVAFLISFGLSALAPSAAMRGVLGAALMLSFLGLIDIAGDREDGWSSDDEDRDGGSRPRPLPRPSPRGGGERDPEWWPDFEQAFWDHVGAGREAGLV